MAVAVCTGNTEHNLKRGGGGTVERRRREPSREFRKGSSWRGWIMAYPRGDWTFTFLLIMYFTDGTNREYCGEILTFVPYSSYGL